ncbi:SRPBCC domain-containing protein [Streptomyces sp. NBC_01142]|uniref:SRPBCC family protein n=1 Tax=Streptomyces sp. NBC_01142 TaxID=2975865 RepID=UPI00225AB342|nr:SRPBCC domain-containing protein [Streptomyces sp. NBC_01142]MCX4824651.1 SRPBCC domain-containing protein [Streptomyces sp. NBC_01142]
MEHEVFVPVPAETLRQVLRDPARVARCVPGLQQDADESAGPLHGRLKVRIGGHTITYRGTLRILEQGDVFAVEGEGLEARGTGSAKVTLTIRPAEAEGGTTLSFAGTARAEGRLAELEDTTTTSAAHRLLDRFADRLATTAEDPLAEGVTGEGPADDAEAPKPSTKPSVFDAPVPPPPLDPVAESEFEASEVSGVSDASDASDVPDAPGAAELPEIHELPVAPDEPPAEAAHARRTMIGRSAEEVDHAPPRGRYAPTPPPEPTTAGAALRWVAPAAALAIASAVVVRRVLRRRA